MASPQLSEIYNFYAVSERLGTAGQPTAEQFGAVKASGYDVVINLAMGNTSRDLRHEAQLLAEHGIEYIHIPVVFEQPTAADLAGFFEAMDTHQGDACFVH